MISENPNTPIASTHEADAVGQFDDVERHAGLAGLDVGADHREQQSGRIIAIALPTEPFASTTANTRPSTISEKYSAGPNFSASFGQRLAERGDEHGGDAAGEERSDAQRSPAPAPARPCFAIWKPSSVVTTDADSPGIFTRIAVVEPPYMAP